MNTPSTPHQDYVVHFLFFLLQHSENTNSQFLGQPVYSVTLAPQCQTVAYQGSEGPSFNSNFGALHFPPLHFPLPPLPFPFPSSFSAQPLPLPRSGPKIQLEGLGERCKLPQRGLGPSPNRNRIWCILALKSVIWWQQL